jgi:hypothetical protein
VWPTVKNLHVTAQTADNKLVLLYNIKQGPSDKSFGIHIAELAGFPPSVIEVAQQKVETLEKTAQSKGVTSGVGQKRCAPLPFSFSWERSAGLTPSLARPMAESGPRVSPVLGRPPPSSDREPRVRRRKARGLCGSSWTTSRSCPWYEHCAFAYTISPS